jgi:hypothetical protein
MITAPPEARRRFDAQSILPGLSVVVSVYRSEAILSQLTLCLENVLPALASAYEVVLVDDASPDCRWQIIRPACRALPMDSRYPPYA